MAAPQQYEFVREPEFNFYHLLPEFNFYDSDCQIPAFEHWNPLSRANTMRLRCGMPEVMYMPGSISQASFYKYNLMFSMKPSKVRYWMYKSTHEPAADLWIREKIENTQPYLLIVTKNAVSPHTIRLSLTNLAADEVYVNTISSMNEFYPHEVAIHLKSLPVDLERVRFVDQEFQWGLFDYGVATRPLFDPEEVAVAVRTTALTPTPVRRITCKSGFRIESAVRLTRKTPPHALFYGGMRFVRSLHFVKRQYR